MALSAFSRRLYASSHTISSYGGIILVFCLGTIISIATFVGIMKENSHKLEQAFLANANMQAARFEYRMGTYMNELQLIGGLYAASENVTPDEAVIFVRPFQRRKEFKALYWLPASQKIWSSFQVLSSSQLLLNTVERRDAGYEAIASGKVLAYPEVQRAIKAVASGQKPVAMTGFFSLSSAAAGRPDDFAIVVPIWKQEQHAIPSGFIVGFLSRQQLFSSLLRFSPSLRDLIIYLDNPDGSGAILPLFSPYTGRTPIDYVPRKKLDKQRVFFLRKTVTVPGTEWTLLIVPTHRFLMQVNSWSAWLLLGVGFMVTGIVGGLLYYLIGRNIKIEKLVAERSGQLQENARALANNENRLRVVMDTVLDGIITINSAGIVQSFNRAAEKIFGYKADEVIGKNIHILMPEPYHSEHDGYIRNYLLTGQAKIIGIGREVEARRKDGSIFPMELGISNMEINGEKIFVGILRDITERKDAENRLANYAQKLEQESTRSEAANKAKSEFLANMSHEIRTPLHGIIGMTELLLNTTLDRQQQQYAEALHNSGEVLLALINDILDFSRLEAGELELQPMPVILKAIGVEIAQLLAARANENNVELAVHCDPELPMTVIADPVRIRQILLNLVGNAIKFSHDGYVLINMHRLHQTAKNVTLLIEVEDNGIGIPADKLDTIFERFMQVNTSTTRRYGGTGLGLAICKFLVARMGGRIGVRSEPGKGSTFWFEITVPIHIDAPRAGTPSFQELRDKRVLIVDDRPISLRVLSEYLHALQVQHDAIASPTAALQAIEQSYKEGRPYDIALIDHEMPEMNGETLGAQIHSHPEWRHTRLILITALGKVENLSAMYEAGYDGCLLKPIYSNTLYQAIQEALQKPQKKSGVLFQISETVKPKFSKIIPRFNATVLLAEDYPPNQKIAQEMLERMGCTVTIATNGEDVIDKLQEHHYDLILMDCQMPEMDGYEATRTIRKQKSSYQTIPIIAMTANALQGDRKICLDAGMNDYISKPMRISELETVLSHYLPTIYPEENHGNSSLYTA